MFLAPRPRVSPPPPPPFGAAPFLQGPTGMLRTAEYGEPFLEQIPEDFGNIIPNTPISLMPSRTTPLSSATSLGKWQPHYAPLPASKGPVMKFMRMSLLHFASASPIYQEIRNGSHFGWQAPRRNLAVSRVSKHQPLRLPTNSSAFLADD